MDGKIRTIVYSGKEKKTGLVFSSPVSSDVSSQFISYLTVG